MKTTAVAKPAAVKAAPASAVTKTSSAQTTADAAAHLAYLNKEAAIDAQQAYYAATGRTGSTASSAYTPAASAPAAGSSASNGAASSAAQSAYNSANASNNASSDTAQLNSAASSAAQDAYNSANANSSTAASSSTSSAAVASAAASGSPQAIAAAIVPGRPAGLLRPDHLAREQLERHRRQPVLRRLLALPPGPARRQDGLRSAPTGRPTPPPRSSGRSSTWTPPTAARTRPGPSGRPTTGTEPSETTPAAAQAPDQGSCGEHPQGPGTASCRRPLLTWFRCHSHPRQVRPER